MAEAALFFNPALWYLSRRISTLREYCCDEITCGAQSASATEPRVRYATALLRVVELAKPNAATAGDLASLAASGRSPSELRRRVARLFDEPLREPAPLSRGGLLTIALLTAVLLTAPTAWRSATNFAATPAEEALGEGLPTSPDEADGLHSIGGVVLDEAGDAVADADVWLSMYCTSDPVGERVQHGNSDSQGRFALEVPSDWFANRSPHSPIILWTYATGHQLGIEQGNILTAAPFEDDVDDLEVRLKAAADTSFVILDPDGKPVADAVVAPYRMTYQATPEEVLRRIETRTDASGRAKLPTVGHDELDTIRVTAEGFGIQMQRDTSPEYPLPAENTIHLRPVGRIEGRILADNSEWARGVRMVLETESLYGNRPSTRGFCQIESDDEGRFTVPRIANGRLVFRFVQVDETLPARPQLPRFVDILANTTNELEIPMTRLVSLRGSVTVKDTDTPVAGMKIRIRDGSGIGGRADSVSDSQGRFTAQALPGSVRLQVYDQSRKYVQLAGVAHEVPNQTEEFTLPPLEVVPTKTITGRLVDERDQPLANADIYIRHGSGKSDADGRFEVVGVPAMIDEATADYRINLDGDPGYKIAPDGTASRTRVQTTVMKTDPLTLRVWTTPATSVIAVRQLRTLTSDEEVKAARAEPNTTVWEWYPQPGKLERLAWPTNGPVLLTEDDVLAATAKRGDEKGNDSRYSVHLQLTPPAGKRMLRETKRIVEQNPPDTRPAKLGIFRDHLILSAPRLQSAIGQQITIAGDFTQEEAEELANAIRPATEAPQVEPTAAAKDTSHEFCLWVNGPDGVPVPNAKIDLRSDLPPTPEQIIDGEFIGTHSYGADLKTDNLGRLTLKFPSRPNRIEFNIKQPGFGPYWAAWYERKAPREFTVELDAAWSVGGVVVDESGQPVEGVEVSPSLHYKKRPGDTRQLGVGSHVVTDADGKWRFDHVPVSKNDVHVSFDHPDYGPLRMRLSRDAFEVKQGESPSAQIELTPGLTVTGTVVDEAGKPIRGVLVRSKFLNDIRETTTDSQGEYRLTGCEPRMAWIVVSAPGRAIDMQEVQVDPDMKPVDFTMSPGGKIRVRVVDEQGRGIPRARIFFQSWRRMYRNFAFDHVSQYTDENGVWQWDEAPLDEFQADICRPGGMQLSDQSLIAREEEYVFKPPRALVISGSVVDTRTKEPIEKFEVIPGGRDRPRQQPGESWMLSESREGSDGKYTIRFTEAAPAHLVRIEAEGYHVTTLRDFMTDEGAVTCDVELQPAEDIGATILTPSGEPAVNAQIAMGVRGSQITVREGAIYRRSTYATMLTADVVGRFNIPSRDDPFQLVITHPAGFAHLKSEDGPIPNPIKLTAWARVEGTFRVGPQPAANVTLSMYSTGMNSRGDDVPNISTRHEVTTDDQGHYVFERALPGKASIGRDVVLMVGDGATEVTSSQRVPMELVAGETTVLNLGGTGRAVVGKLAPPADYTERVLWNFAVITVQADSPVPRWPTTPEDLRDDPEKLLAWQKEWLTTEEGKALIAAQTALQELRAATPHIMATVDRDGSFRIDDMPDGPYVLDVRFDKHSPGSLSGYRFSTPPVEEGRPAEPFDLGTLTLQGKAPI